MRSLVVREVVAALIVEVAGLFALYHITKNSLVDAANKPSPIWATIIVVLVGLLLHIRLTLQIKSFKDNPLKLQKHFGLLWDDELNVHCPACRKLLSNYAYYQTNDGEAFPGFTCINCNNSLLRISDEQQIFMTLEEAKDKIHQKNTEQSYSR